MAGHQTSNRPSPWQKKPQLTHFLCLPLVAEASKPQLEKSLKDFSDDVCSYAVDAESPGPSVQVHPKAIRPLGTLHLTLGVMSLTAAEQLAKASEMLRKLDVAALLNESNSRHRHVTGSDPTLKQGAGASPLRISLKGLGSMHPPASTSILYAAPVDPSERLYDFCLELQKHFQDFLVVDDRPLRLHATIVNTVYAKGRNPGGGGSGGRSSKDTCSSQGHGPNAKSPLKMDARAILEKYGDYTWAEGLRLERIAICEMGAKKVLDEAKVRVLEERYIEVASVALPS